MADTSAAKFDDSKTVPDSVIPCGQLPPLRCRDLPEPVSWRKMVGPSVILAGLALGSGELIFWPYITYQSKFVFFWACVLGVTTQFFINMEITRWSLATGESAVTGFIRISRKFAWAFLLLNIVPWMIPAWAKGAAEIISWLVWGPQISDTGVYEGAPYVTALAIAGMVLCGAILTAGTVVYETLEKIQILLVSLVLALVVVLAVWLLKDRPDAIVAQLHSTVTFGAPDFVPLGSAAMALTPVLLLGALAFAGAGGTTNLGQSNYVKDKGYGMGRYIGRITSPITGQVEATSEAGYYFPDTADNRRRWQHWWRSSNLEHFFSFFLTCMVSLVLLTLISYVLFYDANGAITVEVDKYKKGLGFIWAEASALKHQIGDPAKYLFLMMGAMILLTTEFGVLDVASRISSDIVKVSWLRDKASWTESRLYFFFLWGTIVLGTTILLLQEFGHNLGAFFLFKLSAAMNGGVMFLYSALLLYLNRWKLPAAVRTSGWRALILVWAVLFFGVFAVWAVISTVAAAI